jgi:DNA primase
LDPREEFDKSEINNIIKDIVDNIDNYIKNVADIEVFKSGGRGYHIFIFLDNPMDVDKARKLLKRLAKDIILPKYEKVTTSIPKKDEMRFDVSTLHYKGSLSAPYSLNAKTFKPGEKIDLKKI